MAEIYLVIPQYEPGSWGYGDAYPYGEFSSFSDAHKNAALLTTLQPRELSYTTVGVFQKVAEITEKAVVN